MSHGCVLVIVGSLDLAGNDEAYRAIQSGIEEHDPRLIVSGGAPGVDSMAESVAAALEIEFSPEFTVLCNCPDRHIDPRRHRWLHEYRVRDERMARRADCLLRVYSDTSKTYGSGWTADLAEKLGANVTRILIRRRPYSDTLISA